MSGRLSILIVALVTGVWLPSSARPAHAQAEGNAAFLFGYDPDEGHRALFDEGYRRHLDWHRKHEDPLSWYGWYVIGGERIGMFIDGSFGIPFSAFDERVAPAEDVADAAQTMLPFSRPVFRKAYVMRPDLSTGSPLEDGKTSPYVQVVYYEIRPGMAEAFERVVEALRPALEQKDEVPVHTWYELVVGGAHPTYMLMVPRTGWRSYGSFRETIASAIARTFDSDEANNLLSTLTRTVKHVRSEVWSYRSDLSYFPDE